MESLQSLLGANDLLSSGFILMLLGYALNYARAVPQYAYTMIRRKVVNEVTIPDHDEAYEWVKRWVAVKLADRKHGFWRIDSEDSLSRNNAYPFHYSDQDNGEGRPHEKRGILYAPDEGWHIVWEGWFPIVVYLSRRNVDNSADGRGYFEELTLVAAGRPRSFLERIVKYCQENFSDDANDKYTVYFPEGNVGGFWQKAGVCPARPMESIFYDKKSELINDLRNFMDARQWYEDMGLPHRRGYLFYGPPGNGKTSFARAVASYFRMNIYYLSLSSKALGDERLVSLMQSMRKPSIVLLEDVDCLKVAQTREGQDDSRKSGEDEKGVTLSGLLNALDGVCSSNEYILIMTTNYPDKIDPALLRPGRVDKRFIFNNATKTQAEEMYQRFYPESANTPLPSMFSEALPDGVSMAQLQEIMISADSPGAAVSLLKQTSPALR